MISQHPTGPCGDIRDSKKGRSTCQLSQSSAPCRLTRTLTCWQARLRGAITTFLSICPQSAWLAAKRSAAVVMEAAILNDVAVISRTSLWASDDEHQKHLFTSQQLDHQTYTGDIIRGCWEIQQRCSLSSTSCLTTFSSTSFFIHYIAFLDSFYYLISFFRLLPPSFPFLIPLGFSLDRKGMKM